MSPSLIMAFAWLLVAAAIAAMWLAHVDRDPEEEPGGGTGAIVAVAIAWPFILVLGVILGLVSFAKGEHKL